LQINNATYGSDVVVACDSYTWTDGNTYTSSTNTATDTLVNANGCDSIVTLNLTINHSTSLTVFVEGCGPSYYIIMGDPTNNFFATSDTIVYDSLLTVNGCDSIVVLDITIHDSYSATDSIVACGNSYTWIDGNTYTSNNNSATYSSSTINGCDSIVTLNLTLIDIDTTYMAGGPYELISNQPNATYQWLDCNNGFAPIPGFTNQTLDGYAGNVCVEITYNGCIDTSACMTVSAGSVAESNPFASVSIYPNPSEGPFTIELNDLTTVDMKLVDITGKSIFSAKGISDSKYVMDAEIPAGVYFLTIKVDAQTRTFRVIKK
ncbi:MAG: T9SS type A sorting domain-containing protein, partial [Putridiphycobacter sp.]|nr:T9SS type A sorting domain-containing protein [Putridiphycobacter sp.]